MCLKFLIVSISIIVLVLGGIKGNQDLNKIVPESPRKLGDAPSRPGPGSWIYPTHGEIWPKPQIQYDIDNSTYRLDPTKFIFKPLGPAKDCDVIQIAIDRYYERIFNIPPSSDTKEELTNGSDNQYQNNESEVLKGVLLVLPDSEGCNEYPDDDMDEKYLLSLTTDPSFQEQLEIPPGYGMIAAETNWGIIRGMESFSQLVTSEKGSDGKDIFKVKTTNIIDFPRFSYRGILLDSARHFIPKDVIIDNLNLMEMNKFNVLHWHITDSVSFPYESISFPELSEKGAYSPKHVYLQEDVAQIVDAARIRGIRVIPEFDTPDHADSWGASHPELLTECKRTGKYSRMRWNYGPIDPTKESVYSFLEAFFREIAFVFPDKLMHLGGDEVNTECWKENADIQDYMKEHQITGQYDKLKSMYFNRIIELISKSFGDLSQKKRTMVWQDVLDDGAKIPNDSVIQIWKNGAPSCWQGTMKQVTSKGFEAVLSAPWYLDHMTYARDWLKYYAIDPQNFGGTETEQDLVKGGTACLWAEYVNQFNLIPRLWPRASAIAERLWSSELTQIPDIVFSGCKAIDYDGDTGNGDACWSDACKDAERRLQEHECRMAKRGYPVSPANGPSFCDM